MTIKAPKLVDQNYATWLLIFEKVSALNQWTEEEQLLQALVSLTGLDRSWALHADHQTWSSFVADFKDRYVNQEIVLTTHPTPTLAKKSNKTDIVPMTIKAPKLVDRNYAEWLLIFEKVLAMNQWTEKEQLVHALVSLPGSAQSWALHADHQTWSSFVADFKDRYVNQRIVFAHQSKLLAFKQCKGESYGNYINRLEKLWYAYLSCATVSGESAAWFEPLLIYSLIKGLRSKSLRRILRLEQFASVTEFIKYFRNVDDLDDSDSKSEWRDLIDAMNMLTVALMPKVTEITENQPKPKIKAPTCYHCQEKGHMAVDCMPCKVCGGNHKHYMCDQYQVKMGNHSSKGSVLVQSKNVVRELQ